MSLLTVYLNIETRFKKIVEKLDDSVEAWKKLEVYHFSDNLLQHISVFSEMCNCIIKSNEKVGLYTARLQRIADQLLSITEKCDEIYVCFQHLSFFCHILIKLFKAVCSGMSQRLSTRILLKS